MLQHFQKKNFFSFYAVKRLHKFGECDYKDNTRIVFNKLFSCGLMSETNLKGDDKKNGHHRYGNI